METALQSILLSVPQAAAIWFVLLVLALVAGAALSLRHRQRTVDRSDDAAPRRRRVPGTDRPDPATRFAQEVAVAAERAAATARRRRAEWQLSQDALDTAWAAFEEADRAARRSAAAAAFPVVQGARTPAEYADRERYLHRAATAACRRRELPVAQLSDVLAHRNGWDPRRHPAMQEHVLQLAVRQHWLRTYREAAAGERQAWRTAEAAAAALRSLREEACAAPLRIGQPRRTAEHQWWAEQWATEPVRQTIATAQLVTH